MTTFIITQDIFAQHPGVTVGLVIAHDLNNRAGREDALTLLRIEEAQLAPKFVGIQIIEHPHIAPWREAYRKFGAKPKDHPSSIENLARRVLKGQPVPDINTLVNLYNTISLRFLVPVGGEDLDKIDGDILLTFAGALEMPVRLLGEPEERTPRPGEIIYKDRAGAICRRWNWKEADRTKLTVETKHALLVIEGLPPVGKNQVEEASTELASLIRNHCGGIVSTAILDENTPMLISL